jgi:hypothetical protein
VTPHNLVARLVALNGLDTTLLVITNLAGWASA